MKNSIPYFLIAGVALFMFHGIFAPGFMSGYDNSLHYYELHYLTKVLIPHYHWIRGWSMQGMAGIPIFVDYFQLGFFAAAFLNKALFLDLNLSYKTMVLAAYVILGAGFYRFTYPRFGKVAAFLIAISLMLQKDIYCSRILGGIWSNYLAIGLFFIFFHVLDKNSKAMTIKHAVALGILMGLLILTHVFVSIFGFLILFIYITPCFIKVIKKKEPLKRLFLYAIVPAGAFMISSFYLYDLFIARNYFVKLGREPRAEALIWTLKSFFGPLESPNSISAFMVNVPVVLRIIFGFFGMYLFFRKEKNEGLRRVLACTLVFIFISALIFSDILPRIFSFWGSIPLIATLQINRFLVYIHIGMYIFAAYGIAKFIERFRKKTIAISLCAIPLFLSAFFHYSYYARDASRTLEESPQMGHVVRIWGWVNKNIPASEQRIVYENTFGNVPDPILRRSDVFGLSGVFTEVAQIGVSRPASPFPQEKYMRNDQGSIFGKRIDAVNDGFIGNMMNYFNAGHIVAVEHKLKNKLNRSNLFLKEVDFGDFSVFQLKNFKSDWLKFKKDASYKKIVFENHRLEFHINNKSSGNEAFIKVSYHPLWRAWLNDKNIQIGRDKYSLMKVSLPEKGVYRLVLVFDSFNPLWVGISFLSLTGCAVIFITASKR